MTTSKAQSLVSRDEVLVLIAAKKKVFGGATTDICLNGLARDIAALPNAKADDVRGEWEAFARELIDGSNEGGSFDGCEIQDMAVEHGLLKLVEVMEACGEGCACAAVDTPPYECYRYTTNPPRSAR